MPVGVRGDLRLGKRFALKSEAAVLAAQAPQRMRELLAPHVDEYVKELLSDMRDRGSFDGDGKWCPNSAHRTAMDLIPAILQAIGAQNMLVFAFLDRFGVESAEELDTFVQRGRKSGDANPETVIDRAKDLLRERMRIEPGYRRALLWELFGIREASTSEAVVVESAPTNGHTNGHNGHA